MYNTNFYYQAHCKTVATTLSRTLGMYLFRIRQLRRLSLIRVCQDLRITPRQLDAMETGKCSLRNKNLDRLIAYYNVRPELTIVNDTIHNYEDIKNMRLSDDYPTAASLK